MIKPAIAIDPHSPAVRYPAEEALEPEVERRDAVRVVVMSIMSRRFQFCVQLERGQDLHCEIPRTFPEETLDGRGTGGVVATKVICAVNESDDVQSNQQKAGRGTMTVVRTPLQSNKPSVHDFGGSISQQTHPMVVSCE